MSKYKSDSLNSSFKHAIDGFALIYKSQRNIKIQILAALFTILFAILLRFNAIEFVILFILITSVIAAEMVNTVIEFILDSIYKRKYSRIAKIAKDMSAGMVMFVSLSAVVSGIILFGYKCLDYVNCGEYYLWY